MSDTSLPGPRIRIPDITKPERTQLLQTAPAGLFTLEDQKIDSGQVGELLTATAVAWLTKVAVTALVTWLLKTSDRKKVRKRVMIQKPDGTIVTIDVTIDLSSSTAPDAQVIGQINQLLSSEGLPELSD